jgi:outer membrane protein assembly factor BamB
VGGWSHRRGGRAQTACPACGVPVPHARRTAARWCGSCGAQLTTEDEPATADTHRWHRHALSVAAGGVALAVLVTFGVGTAGDRPVTLATDSLDVDLDAQDAERVVTAPVSDDGPVCLRDPDCVVWVEPASVAGRSPVATVVGDLTLVRVHDALEARDTETGTLRWRTPLADAAELRTYLPVHAASGLVLVGDTTTDARVLLALDLHTGVVRWSLPHVEAVTAVQEHGTTLLAQVTRAADRGSGVSVADGRNATEQILALDPTSGEVLWSRGGDLLHLLDDGAVVVATSEVAVIDADGTELWRRPLDDDASPAWLDVTGRFLRLFDGTGRGGPRWSLTDGSVLDAEGELVPVADVVGRPADPFRSGIAALLARRPDGGTELALVDGDDIRWRVSLGQLVCCAPIQLDDDAIVVPAADGGRWHLSRSDGELLDRDDAPTTRAGGATEFLPSYGGFSVEELDVAAATTSDLALVEGGERTVRVPAGTWPVGATDDVVVLRSHAWVAAIERDTVAAED